MGATEALGLLGETRLETARGLVLWKFVVKLHRTMLPGFVGVKRYLQAHYGRDVLESFFIACPSISTILSMLRSFLPLYPMAYPYILGWSPNDGDIPVELR